MSIWVYDEAVADKDAVLAAISTEKCIFCTSVMTVLKDERETHEFTDALQRDDSYQVRFCEACGWWWKSMTEYSEISHNLGGRGKIPRSAQPPGIHETRVFGAAAVLKNFDPQDISAPLGEVRDYLTARYDARFQIDPFVFERTVGSVFGDLGFQARVTARSGDDGIDVVLDGPGDKTIGVQVKRSKNRISVEKIRAFAGALLLNGWTEGVFVTTSDYQSGAAGTAKRYERLRGMKIQLYDAKRLFEALKIAQRNRYGSLRDETAPFHRISPMFLQSSAHPLFEMRFASETEKMLDRRRHP